VADWSSPLRSEWADLVPYVPARPCGVAVTLGANEAPPIGSQKARDLVARTIARTELERHPDAGTGEPKAQERTEVQAHVKKCGVSPVSASGQALLRRMLAVRSFNPVRGRMPNRPWITMGVTADNDALVPALAGEVALP
jgi:histidinol-phosphate/aromatic aminotransferase/cobyric acid decarboxylase-like protein